MPRPLTRGIPGFEPKISLGQNFLFDAELLARLVRETGLGPGDDVLEIGAGRGDLTLALAAVCHRVVALEVDPRLEPVLEERLRDVPNAQVVMADATEADIPALMGGLPFHVAANLPYYLTTPLLTMLLKLPAPIRSVSVMVQEEAAARIMAQPGTGEYGPLAVLTRWKANPRAAAKIPARMFTPPPKVDSVFLVMPFHAAPPVHVRDEAHFLRTVTAAFAMRRKTLLNNLMPAFGLSREEAKAVLQTAGLREDVRGEALNLAEFAALSNSLVGLRETDIP
ncbi:MAG TPA: 16S rRNA (adenine(1518)-N(6)/adenine(1519)-N(6))-dimethyltransferase RsmA [Candidatus Limnocylindria bacterium]|nr:16S rRNA (adenine(1518)-N(6)/adenine(1519)-N(6))-dimethyltransferase RsmA [Candidatus Limnocylindria bacterium]